MDECTVRKIEGRSYYLGYGNIADLMGANRFGPSFRHFAEM